MNNLRNMNKSNLLLLILVLMFGVIFGMKVIFSWNKKLNETCSVSEETISYNNLPNSFDGYKILQLSDLHSKEFGKDNEYLISQVKKINPDVIMVTGDMFSVTDLEIFSDETKLVSFKLLSELAKDYKIIYVTGNHEEGRDEVYNGNNWKMRNRNKDNSFNRYLKKLQNTGVVFVDNDKYKLYKDDEFINVYGIYYRSLENGDSYMRNLTGDKDEFNVLLCHNPAGFDDFSQRNFNLMLAGHVHGGVIRLPFVGGVLDPERRLFPKYDKGVYEMDGSYMNVSVGLGDASIGRFNNKPEINLIILRN